MNGMGDFLVYVKNLDSNGIRPDVVLYKTTPQWIEMDNYFWMKRYFVDSTECRCRNFLVFDLDTVVHSVDCS